MNHLPDLLKRTLPQAPLDAMMPKKHHRQADWSVEALLFRREKHHGWSYRAEAVRTPFLRPFSNRCNRRKVVSDHVYDEDAVSRQVGAAVLHHARCSPSHP